MAICPRRKALVSYNNRRYCRYPLKMGDIACRFAGLDLLVHWTMVSLRKCQCLGGICVGEVLIPIHEQLGQLAGLIV